MELPEAGERRTSGFYSTRACTRGEIPASLPCLTIIARPCVKLPVIRNEETITAPLYLCH